MTPQRTISLHADNDGAFEDWIENIRRRFVNKPTSGVYHYSLNDVIIVLQISKNRRTRYFAASAGLLNQEVHELLFGRIAERIDCPSCVICVQCGLLTEPFNTRLLTSTDGDAARLFVCDVTNDVKYLKNSVNTLSGVFLQLIENNSALKYFEPSGVHKRALFASAVAFALGEPWEDLIITAKQSKIAGFRDWAGEVEKRMRAGTESLPSGL